MNRWLLTAIMLLLLVWPHQFAGADEDHEAKQRLEKIEEDEEDDESEQGISVSLPYIQKVTVNGFIEFNYDYTDTEETDDKDSGSDSDLYIGSIEVALRFFFSPWAKAKVAVNVEDVFKDDDEDFNIDEALLTLKAPWVPLYVKGGKTVLPFGVFEDHLISGTLTEDLYEIHEWGATLGLAPEFYGPDLSVTIYEGQHVIDNLVSFDTHEFRDERQNSDEIDSFIANLTIEPIADHVFVSTFYNSEPGDGNRNESVGGAVTLALWDFLIDTEYITALAREKGDNGEENKESAWFLGLAYMATEELELAVRYEGFDDDTRGDQDEVVDYRCLAGFNYALSDFATFSFEYRYTEFEKESGSDAADDLNELFFQLALEF
jgi:opacity protein-like surface antigen